jgi:hypothetical protein
MMVLLGNFLSESQRLELEYLAKQYKTDPVCAFVRPGGRHVWLSFWLSDFLRETSVC